MSVMNEMNQSFMYEEMAVLFASVVLISTSSVGVSRNGCCSLGKSLDSEMKTVVAPWSWSPALKIILYVRMPWSVIAAAI